MRWLVVRQMLTAAELRSMSLDPGWADADERSFLLVDLDHPTTAEDAAHLLPWLTSLPVPVVGVGEEGASPLEAGVDLVVSLGELDRAIANIRLNPQASAVLVQVVRSSESLDVVQALALESLGYATLQGGAEFAAWLAARRLEHAARFVANRDDIVLMARTGDTLDIVLNSPDTRNSLSVPMRDALTEAFKLVAMDASILNVEVSGNGPCFSAGGDLEEFGALTDPAEAHRIRTLRMPARYLAPCAARYHFRLHGACIGAGIELPAFAGHLTASAETFFQLPEISMGLIPGAGGCVSIPRRIGRRRTAYMAILNKKIPAEQALAFGLIDAIED